MGGFDGEATAKVFNIPDKCEPITVIAVGRPGDPSGLSGELWKREQPGTRRPAGYKPPT